ncbi:MAG TPA: endonuclease III [Thermoplasmatales archaeon]|nr:endonuclease III [Thermoplasmatales archaeon]
MKLSQEILSKMEKKYSKYWWKEDEELQYKKISKDAFKLLIFTVLSQNTSGANTRKAYIGLQKKFDVTPSILANVDVEEIAEAIKPGGLHNIKARRIKKISQEIIERYGGDLNKILNKRENLKGELMNLSGIGNKTADVIISSLYGHRNAFVVDTHMKRVAIRIGIANEKSSYEEIQKALREIFPWERISEDKEERIAGLFWLMAKYTCDARKPKCEECLLKKFCKFYKHHYKKKS